MSFMIKKKKFKFKVSFEVEELSSVPFISGILFCKTRLIDGGSFSSYSTREEVSNHVVKWKASYEFQTKLAASATTGELESCMCRVSVRKELKGGKSYQKLGYADVNLSEFAGCGSTSRRYILEGYDTKRRQDNSILKINIDMSLLEGYPLFKVPQSKSSALSADLVDELQPENKGGGESEPCTTSMTSACSSGFGSLPRTHIVADDPPPECKKIQQLKSEDSESNIQAGHARTSSVVSNQSKGSGYSSTHSRNSSIAEEMGDKSHKRSASAGSHGNQVKLRPHSRKALDTTSSIEKRVDATRISAEDLVNELIAATDFDIDESAETSGLQLYVGKDGQAIVGGQHDRSQIAAGHFERVIIDKK